MVRTMSGHPYVSCSSLLLSVVLARVIARGHSSGFQVALDAAGQAEVVSSRLIRTHRQPVERTQAVAAAGILEMETLSNESFHLDQRLQSVARTLRIGSPTKDFLMKLSLCVPCSKFERFGDPVQGYVLCADDVEQDGLVAAYSYGVDSNDSWGMDIASRRGLPVHEYAKDCVELRRPDACKGCQIHFHTDCVAGARAPIINTKYKTLTQNLKDNGHAEDGSLLLKLDANGNEWEVFAEEPVSTFQKFRQVAVKFHKEKHNLYLRAVQKLEESGFAVAFLAGQKYGKLTHFERDLRNFHIPDELEVVYMQLPSQGCSQELKFRVPDDSPDIVPEQTVLEQADPNLPARV